MLIRILRIALWWACLLLQPLSANAQTDTATAEELMRRSGMWEQLVGIAPQVRAGLFAGMSQTGARPSASESERLGRAVDNAYSASKLRRTAMKTIRQGLDVAYVPELRRWYATPAGKSATAMEEASSSDKRDPKVVLAEGAKLLNDMPAARRDLITELVKVTRSAESMVQMTINVTLATQRGASSVAPNLPRPSQAELRKLLDAQRPQLLQAYTGMALASSAKTYETLSTAMLAQYVEFLKSDAGRHFSEVGIQAIEAAMVEASTELGRRLPASKDQANT